MWVILVFTRLPRWRSGKVRPHQCKRHKAQDLIPESGRSPEGGNGSPLWYSCPSHGQRSLVGYSPWGCKELDMTERLRAPIFSTVHLKGKIFIVISSIHIVRARTIPSLSILFLSFPQGDQTSCPCILARWVTPGGWPLSVLVYKIQLWPTLMGDVQPVTWTLQHIKTTCVTHQSSFPF